MDTKSKRFRKNRLLKTLAFLMAVFSLTTFVLAADLLAGSEVDIGYLLSDTYRGSTAFESDYRTRAHDAIALLKKYKSEDNIRSGGTVDADRLKSYINYSDRNSYAVDEEGNWVGLTSQAKQHIKEVTQRLIQQDLNSYFQIIELLDKTKYFYYYLSDGVNTYTNGNLTEKEQFMKMPFYAVYEYGQIETADSRFAKEYFYPNYFSDKLSPDSASDIIMLAFSEEFFTMHERDWNDNRLAALIGFSLLAGALLLFLLSFAWSIAAAGWKKGEEKIHLTAFDSIYTDILLIFTVFSGILIASGAVVLNEEINPPLSAALVLITSPFFLGMVLSLVRHIKNKSLVHRSLLYRFIGWIGHGIRKFLNSKPYTKKMIWITIGYSILLGISIFIFPVFILLVILAVRYIIKKCQDFNAIADGVKQIRAGDLNHKITVDDQTELKELSENINQITEGLSNAIDNELKSDRLKTELITNVSHDIRTPLTSIITYVDLLKKDGPQGENFEKYVSVLSQKSERLKILTDDLFEAAKAQSGNVETHLEKVDIHSLITQGLGELDNKIKASGLEFKLNCDGNAAVLADGRLLWRVIENLMSNIFKYAMKGSRVYIDIRELESAVQFAIKNVSAYELNIAPDELMQRFTRGDESRHTEGSGLGLAIAESLIEAQNGTFSIEIDGDLFKAAITLPKFEAKKETQS